jgi:hypothetical protein
MLKDAEFKKPFDVFLHFFQKLTLRFMNFVRYFIITLYTHYIILQAY